MTVLDFIKSANFKDFYCVSNITIVLHYQGYYKRHGEMIPKKKTECAEHYAINLCHTENWEKYKSYNRFANREVVKIKGNTIYTKWTINDLKNEFIQLYGGDKYCKVLSVESKGE